MIVPFVPGLFSTAWKHLPSPDQVRGDRSRTQVPDETNTIKQMIKMSVSNKKKNFSGQCVDGPPNGVSPPPWLVQVSYPPKFTDAVQKVRVPHSSFIKVCL